ncbi:hypothetical protein D029_2796A, partial [Vibrio parahaemolyticus 970107]
MRTQRHQRRERQ